MGPGKVEVQSIDFPKLMLGKRKCEHGVVLKIVSTNICGSDQHMVRGRTTAPAGLVLGHELTGEVIEAPEGFDDWLQELRVVADEGTQALQRAWQESDKDFRRHFVTTDKAGWETLKDKAAQASAASAEDPAHDYQ